MTVMVNAGTPRRKAVTEHGVARQQLGDIAALIERMDRIFLVDRFDLIEHAARRFAMRHQAAAHVPP